MVLLRIRIRLWQKILFEEHPEAKDSFQIHIVDSTTYSMVYGYAVIEAAEKAKKGAPVNEIIGVCRRLGSFCPCLFCHL